MGHRHFFATGSVMLLFGSLYAQSGGDFEVARSTIDGGGVVRSTGGEFELSGTAGQPDASGVMAGGDFELTGGFWIRIPPGDCEEDGDVDLLDHDLLAGCMTGPAGAVTLDCRCFDLDGSNTVDLRDLAAAHKNFTGS